MWVYEGQTEYWGDVLTPRSGLGTVEEAIVNLAEVAGFYDNQPGRQWRALQDTNNHNLLGYRTSNPWPSWMRGTGDYYREALLIWLDADTLIREATNERKSLDDFARAFYGVEDGVWEARPYTFEDVVSHLNAVHPHDWATFLRTRLDAVGPDAEAPLDGIERAGWELVAVGDRVGSAEALRDAVTAAKTGTDPIVLVVRRGDEFRTLSFDYHGGLRYPRLVRIEGTRDRLADIFAPRRR